MSDWEIAPPSFQWRKAAAETRLGELGKGLVEVGPWRDPANLPVALKS